MGQAAATDLPARWPGSALLPSQPPFPLPSPGGGMLVAPRVAPRLLTVLTPGPSQARPQRWHRWPLCLVPGPSASDKRLILPCQGQNLFRQPFPQRIPL